MNEKPTILIVLKALSKLVFRFWLIVAGAVIIFLIFQRFQPGVADLDLPHFVGVSFILLAISVLLRLPATLFQQR